MTWQDDYRQKRAAEHFRLGSRLGSDGDWEGAREQFRQAVNLVPDKLIFRQYLMEVTLRTAKPARDTSEVSLENNSAIKQHLRWCTKERHWEQALGSCERGLDLFPNDAWLNAEMGKTMQALGVTDIAIYFYQRATTLDPSNDEFRRNFDRLKDHGDSDSGSENPGPA